MREQGAHFNINCRSVSGAFLIKNIFALQSVQLAMVGRVSTNVTQVKVGILYKSHESNKKYNIAKLLLKVIFTTKKLLLKMWMSTFNLTTHICT